MISPVRVPLSISIALCLLIPLMTWWLGSRNRDFLQAPSSQKLEVIRLNAIQSLIPAARPDEDSLQSSSPVAAVNRNHRPSSQPFTVVLHAGTEQSAAEAVKPALEKTARDLENSSAGALTVTSQLSSGADDPLHSGTAPVALWISGPNENSPSTEILSFSSSALSSTDDPLGSTTYQILRGYGSREANTTLPELNDTAPADAFRTSIPRHLWKTLGEKLNHTP